MFHVAALRVDGGGGDDPESQSVLYSIVNSTAHENGGFGIMID